MTYSYKINAQLNSSSEVIETEQSIEIIDERVEPNAPKTDEEFSRDKISDEADIVEEEIKQSEDSANQEPELKEPEEEYVERQELELDGKEKKDLEKTLEETAEKERPKDLEQTQEGIDGFVVEPSPEENSEQDKQVEKPTDISPLQEEVSEAEEQEEYYIEDKPKEEYVVVPSYSRPLTDKEIDRLEEKTKIEIEKEPFYDQTISAKEKDYLKSFRDRRPSWTRQVSLEYTMYEPIYYESGIEELGFPFYDEYYVSADTPLAMVGIDFKKNYDYGALGVGFSAGYFSASADESDLRLITLSARAHVYLDTLFAEPYLVPYATGGYMYTDYLEEYSGAEFDEEYSGGTGNFYVGGGMMLQLDWIDKQSDVASFQEGLENTFIFAEGRMILDSGISKTSDDPDFSSDIFLSSGMRLEF